MKHLFARARLALLPILTFLLVAFAYVAPAHAEWIRDDLPWVRVNSSNYRSPVNLPDTLWTTFAASKVDTSAIFTVDKFDNPPPAVFNKVSTTADSLMFAKLVIYGDSTVASTISFKATTCKLQANFSGNDTGWQDIYTYTSAQTDGTKDWQIPLFVNPIGLALIDKDLGPDNSIPGSLFGANLRVIVTGGSSVAGAAMRMRLIRYLDAPTRFEGER